MSRNSKAPKLAVKGHFIDLPTVVHERNSLDNTRPLWTPRAFSQFPWNQRFMADQEYLMRRGIQDWKCDMTVRFRDANISKFSKTTIQWWNQPKPTNIRANRGTEKTWEFFRHNRSSLKFNPACNWFLVDGGIMMCDIEETVAAMQSGFSGDGTSSNALYYHWGALHMHLAAIRDAQARAFAQRKELNITIIIAICTEPSSSSSYHATHDNVLVVKQDANGKLRRTAHWFEPWAQGPPWEEESWQ